MAQALRVYVNNRNFTLIRLLYAPEAVYARKSFLEPHHVCTRPVSYTREPHYHNKHQANTKIPLRISSERNQVLRTGIELYRIISKLRYLQADLQAVAEYFVKSAFIVRLASQKATLREIGCSRWLSQMKRRFFRDVSPHLHERPSQHLLPPWQSLHFLLIPEDFVPC